MTSAGAELRTLRVLTLGLGATTAVGVLATTVLIPEPDWMLFGTWYPGLVVLLATLPIAVGACAPWAGSRLLRVLGGVIVVEYALLLTVLLTAALVGRVDGQLPWFLSVTAIPAGAALVAGGRLAAWSVLGAGTVLVPLVRVLTDDHWVGAVANDVLAFFASAVLLLLFGRLLRVSRELDASIAEGIEATRLRSAAQAEDRVRDRMRGFVHDELLYLLTTGARDVPSLRASVAAEARRIRRAISDLHEGPEPGPAPAVTTRELSARLAAVVAHELPGASPTVEVTDGEIAAHVADAVEGAVRQSLVNARTHAGDSAVVSVAVALHEDRVGVTVSDDGLGFDPEAVPPERMGIASSIVGRISAIPGGSARVASRPGAGTTVTIEWVPPRVTSTSGDDRDGGVLAGEGERTRRGLFVAAGAFLLAQAGLAGLAGARTDEPWVQLLAFAGVAAGLLLPGWRTLERPGGRRAAAVVAVAAGVGLLTLIPAARDPLYYGDLWYVPALGFALLALAARGRPGYALVGGGLLAGIAVAGLALANDPQDVVAATTRMTAVLGLGVCLSVATTRARRRVTAVRSAELEAVRESTFHLASRRALRDRSRELEALVAPTLTALERGTALDVDERQECAALEGRLRDQYRAGRLGRPSLVRSAMAARRRGVDVALLDDGSDRTLAEHEVDRIVTWMSELLDAATAGPVTGRILPAGRDAVASLVTGSEVALLPADG